jgi:hypothetical protein
MRGKKEPICLLLLNPGMLAFRHVLTRLTRIPIKLLRGASDRKRAMERIAFANPESAPAPRRWRLQTFWSRFLSTKSALVASSQDSAIFESKKVAYTPAGIAARPQDEEAARFIASRELVKAAIAALNKGAAEAAASSPLKRP